MKKNIIIILQSIIILIIITINLVIIFSKNEVYYVVNEGKIEDYQGMIDGYIPEAGYVPDAITAIKIEKAIFSTMDINDGKYIVEYDKKEQVWIVQNASIIRNPAYAVICKSDGKIIRAWETK